MPKVKSVRINMKGGPLEGLFITDIPASARLVVLIGPNGSGKTSLLDAFKVNESGGKVKHSPAVVRPVEVECHNSSPSHEINLYIRSAYRTEHSLNIQAGLMVIPALPATPPRGAPRSNTQDARVAPNFQNLLHQAHQKSTHSPLTWTEAVKELFSPISQRLKRLFPYLGISDIEYPTGGNETGTLETLCFERSGARYRYEYLSAGEKEVFDLLFDLDRSRQTNQDALYCIDEPELHLHSELQVALMVELLNLLPDASQLWIATHSIGIIRKAMERHRSNPGEVVFLDFGELQSGSKELRPSKVNRSFWKRILAVALHDMADLACPEQIVICEGKPLSAAPPPASKGKSKNSEFDAQVYRTIFSESHPSTEFVSAGCSNDIIKDSVKLGVALGILVPGVEIVKLIDRDNNSLPEVTVLRDKGVKVLSRYSIENYLWSDEILQKLMRVRGCSAEDEQKILASKTGLVKRISGGPEDPMEGVKDIVGPLYQECMHITQLKGNGSNPNEFALRRLVPLVTEDTNAYKELEHDIFS